jgi:hypothetical protein
MSVEAIDSHYNYVKGRVQQYNGARKFSGITDTKGWPPPRVDLNAFYLITLGDTPAGKQVYSPSNTWYRDTVQWSWIVAGSDLPSAGIAGRSRGDVVLIHGLMKKELRFGAFPLACEKLSMSLDQSGSGAVVKTSFDPKQYVYWTLLEFTHRVDRESGLIYGLATTYLSAVAEQITA